MRTSPLPVLCFERQRGLLAFITYAHCSDSVIHHRFPTGLRVVPARHLSIYVASYSIVERAFYDGNPAGPNRVRMHQCKQKHQHGQR